MSAAAITSSHLQRLACLSVRQSTLQQVFTHTESTTRQYALRDRALALGWPAEQIVVIDQDLGQSGASAADRLGFQRLVADVGLGKVGLVIVLVLVYGAKVLWYCDSLAENNFQCSGRGLGSAGTFSGGGDPCYATGTTR
jgi:Resolvase, N terminal domain